MSIDELLDSVVTLAPLLATHLPAGRDSARLPAAVVDALVERGLFRLWIPRRFGGLELTLPEGLKVCEAVSRLDGSAGWAVMIGAGGGLFAAYLEPDVAQRLFGTRAAVVAGSGAPTGTAERLAGGYRARGQWRYASGAHYASVFTANCQVLEGGQPVIVDGAPLIRAMAFAPEDVEILPTWDTTGLRATGSHDIRVREAFVPERETFSVLTDRPREPGPLYRLPFNTLTELPVSAVIVGIARRALAEFESLAATKPSPYGTGSLATQPRVASTVSATRRVVEGSADTLGALAEAAWLSATADGAPDPTVIDACRNGSVQLVADIRSAIGALLPLAGMNAVHRTDPFSVAWQDLAAAAAHYSVSPLAAD